MFGRTESGRLLIHCRLESGWREFTFDNLFSIQYLINALILWDLQYAFLFRFLFVPLIPPPN